MSGVLQSGRKTGMIGETVCSKARAGLMIAVCAGILGMLAVISPVQAQQPIRVQPHVGMNEPMHDAIIACHKPAAPICMKDGTTFVSADRMSSCQFEVKEYVDRTMTYLHCLNDENRKTGEELTRNVDSFNCRLSGGRSCP